MTLVQLFGPRQYRRFVRWSGYFLRVMPWLWFGGIGALLAVSVLKLDKRYGITLGFVCAFTIWPALIGWFAFSGIGIIWKFTLGVQQAIRRRQRPESWALAFAISILLAGVVFLGCAIMLTSTLIRQALTNR